MQDQNITYEYKTLTVSRKLETLWEDSYTKFGWELVKRYASSEKVELEFKRDKNFPKKNELNRLQGYCENTMGEMEHMERTKMVNAYAGSTVCGLLGAVCMAFSVFSRNVPENI